MKDSKVKVEEFQVPVCRLLILLHVVGLVVALGCEMA